MIWIFLLFLLAPLVGQAQTLATGNDALQTMNVPAGAKAAALGGAFSAWDDDTSSVYWNPAGMVWLPKPQVETAYNQWFQDTFFQDASGVYPMDWGAVGGRLSYINLGSITGRDSNGTPTGLTISPEDWGGAFATAVKLDNFSVGVAAKSYAEILSNAYGYGVFSMDAGGMLRLGVLGLAAGARNIGLVSPFNSLTEYYSGGSLALGSKQFSFHVGTDVTSSDGGVILHNGLELGYQQTVFIRAGLQWYPQPLPGQEEGGLSGGVGVDLGDFKMDYSIADYGDLGLTNRLSVGYQFTLPDNEGDDFGDERVSTSGSQSHPNGSSPTARQTASSNPKTQSAPPAEQLKFSASATDMTYWEPHLTAKGAYKIAIGAYKAQNYERAVKYLKKAISLGTSADSAYLAEANAMLGVIYQYDVDTANSDALARQYYRAALKIDPTNSSALTHLPELDPNHYTQPSR